MHTLVSNKDSDSNSFYTLATVHTHSEFETKQSECGWSVDFQL